MRSKIIIVLTIVFLILSNSPGPAFSYWIWTPETKRWVNPKYAPKDTPKEQLLYAMDFYQEGDYKKALNEFNKIIKYYKRSEAASEAQYYIGLCYEKMEKPYPAFEAYQKVIEDYPFTQRTDEIIERQFNITEMLFEGGRTKVFGVGFKAFPEQIAEAYKKIVSNAPYSKYAPIAQYRIGELYKKIEFYEEARQAFEKIVEDYPDSDVAADAKFQVAFCASVASGKSGYDQELTKEAIREYEEFAESHPESELVKEADKERKALIDKRASSYFKIAKFYERVGKQESASLYYNKILEEFPEASIMPEVLERLEVVEKRLKRKESVVQ